MSWFDRDSDKTKAAADAAQFPLGARLKGAVIIDPTPFKLAGDAYGFECPEGAQIIEAIGRLDLGEGALLHRLYLTDDAFVQVATTNGNVGDIALFVYVDSINPANQGAFRQWVEPGSLLGAATYTVGERSYRRVWGDGVGSTAAPDWSPPVALDEDVYKTTAANEDYDLTLYTMLYEREVGEGLRNELLLVAAEDSGPNEFVISIALGVPLTLADFEIT